MKSSFSFFVTSVIHTWIADDTAGWMSAFHTCLSCIFVSTSSILMPFSVMSSLMLSIRIASCDVLYFEFLPPEYVGPLVVIFRYPCVQYVQTNSTFAVVSSQLVLQFVPIVFLYLCFVVSLLCLPL
jgi:hypothetical protein